MEIKLTEKELSDLMLAATSWEQWASTTQWFDMPMQQAKLEVIQKLIDAFVAKQTKI